MDRVGKTDWVIVALLVLGLIVLVGSGVIGGTPMNERYDGTSVESPGPLP